VTSRRHFGRVPWGMIETGDLGTLFDQHRRGKNVSMSRMAMQTSDTLGRVLEEMWDRLKKAEAASSREGSVSQAFRLKSGERLVKELAGGAGGGSARCWEGCNYINNLSPK